MANVDLVDLLPILKAILRVKEEYKQALNTTEGDFGVYPVLTQNFLDESYNNGYEVGFKQCLSNYLNSYEGIEILRPRQMREVVSTNFSDSGSYDYDTLTSIMYYCLRIRRNLKTILDLDTDLFELYPPQLITLAGGQYEAGLNDGYIAGLNYIEEMTILPPTINYANNYFWLTSSQSSIPTLELFYKVGSLEGDWISYEPGTKLPIDTNTRVYAYAKVGTKNSEVASRLCEYNDFLTPTINFTNNIIYIVSNYGEGDVKTKYKLSTWENYNEFIDYDGQPIPITESTTVWAYNYLEDKQSDTVSEICTPTVTPVERPSTPTIYFSPETNIVTISCSTPGAKIYYHKEGSNAGWIEYNGSFKIVESGTYTAMSILDGVESNISNPVVCNVSVSGGGVTPSTQPQVFVPTVVCNNNKVFVYSTQSGVTLYLMKVRNIMYGGTNVDPANNMYTDMWYAYNGPVPISISGTYRAKAVLNSDNTKYAYSVDVDCIYSRIEPGSGSQQGGGSGSSTDEYVAPPLMSCNNSILTINPITPGSVVYYREKGTETWIQYTSPITITDTIIYEAKAVKNGYESSINELECIGEVPVAPVATITDFTVTIASDTPGATIKYREQGTSTWLDYGGPFNIYEDTTFEMKAVKNGFESTVTTQTLQPSVYPCVIGFYSNIITITCQTQGATIKYKKSTDSNWSDYTGPFSINASATYEAKAIANGVESQITSRYCEYYVNYSNEYFTVEVLENNTNVYLTWSPNYAFDTEIPYYYSVNNGAWTKVDIGQEVSQSPILSAGDKIRFKASEYNLNGIIYHIYTVVVGRYNSNTNTWEDATYNAYGNVMSLFNYETFSENTPYPSYSIEYLFRGTNIVSAENLVLPYLNLPIRAFTWMFRNCTELITAPNLIATVLSDYCYELMFDGCTSLTNVQPILPATTLTKGCYEKMFNGCTSLTTAPELPATTIAETCYDAMFRGCTSLTTAPELPAQSLALVGDDTYSGCYDSMFDGCTSLESIKCMAEQFGIHNNMLYWVRNVSQTGTFTKKTGITWPTGIHGIPTGWTVEESNS